MFQSHTIEPPRSPVPHWHCSSIVPRSTKTSSHRSHRSHPASQSRLRVERVRGGTFSISSCPTWVRYVSRNSVTTVRPVLQPNPTNPHFVGPYDSRPSGTNHDSSLRQDPETYLSVLAVVSQQLHKPHCIHPTRGYDPSQPVDPQRCAHHQPV